MTGPPAAIESHVALIDGNVREDFVLIRWDLGGDPAAVSGQLVLGEPEG